jgi:hypothetical protein
MKWRIYYSDGATFSDADGAPEDAPPDGIQVIVQEDERAGRAYIEGNDFYVWDGERWVGMDDDGMKTHFRLSGLLKQGYCLSRRKFDVVLNRAFRDPDFPKKSKRYPDESEETLTDARSR